MKDTVWVVDRLEGDRVVLTGDDEQEVELAGSALPLQAQEGMVLRVPSGPDWAHARHDPAEERRRLDDASARLDRLRRRDPGGDVVL